jgi:hypothetical protein
VLSGKFPSKYIHLLLLRLLLSNRLLLLLGKEESELSIISGEEPAAAAAGCIRKKEGGAKGIKKLLEQQGLTNGKTAIQLNWINFNRYKLQTNPWHVIEQTDYRRRRRRNRCSRSSHPIRLSRIRPLTIPACLPACHHLRSSLSIMSDQQI